MHAMDAGEYGGGGRRAKGPKGRAFMREWQSGNIWGVGQGRAAPRGPGPAKIRSRRQPARRSVPRGLGHSRPRQLRWRGRQIHPTGKLEAIFRARANCTMAMLPTTALLPSLVQADHPSPDSGATVPVSQPSRLLGRLVKSSQELRQRRTTGERVAGSGRGCPPAQAGLQAGVWQAGHDAHGRHPPHGAMAGLAPSASCSCSCWLPPIRAAVASQASPPPSLPPRGFGFGVVVLPLPGARQPKEAKEASERSINRSIDGWRERRSTRAAAAAADCGRRRRRSEHRAQFIFCRARLVPAEGDGSPGELNPTVERTGR